MDGRDDERSDEDTYFPEHAKQSKAKRETAQSKGKAQWMCMKFLSSSSSGVDAS